MVIRMERRGITSNKFSKKRSIFRLDKDLQMKPNTIYKSDAERIRDFQRKLYLKAKQEKEFKFYVLYDKIRGYRFLMEAYKRVKSNKGACGIDGMTFDKIEEYGIEKYINEIQDELAKFTYKPSPVKRVYIPKGNGKTRPLGIPTIRDRIVQMSCKMVIEPIFEADFEDSSYGFRPKRSASNAIGNIKENLKSGKTEIVDADLSQYFDTIPHDKLLILIGKRISDKNVLHLIKMWLKSPIWENGKISGGKKNKKGTPQGGVISPLLANIYLHLLDKIVNKSNGIFEKLGIKIVRYADDFVLMGNKITQEVINNLKHILNRMELVINKEKSKIINARLSSFDFLGFTFRFDKDIFGKKTKYWNIFPSKKAFKKLRNSISCLLKSSGHLSPKLISTELNLILRGWLNYFTIPNVSYTAISRKKLRYYLWYKLKQYYKRKSQRKSKLYNLNAFDVLIEKYGMINPLKYSGVKTCESLR